MADRYAAAFRSEAVKLVLEQGQSIPEAARQLSMSKQTLDRWVRRARQGSLAGMDQHRTQPVDDLNAEIARLKRELANAQMECTFLKNRPWGRNAPYRRAETPCDYLH